MHEFPPAQLKLGNMSYCLLLEKLKQLLDKTCLYHSLYLVELYYLIL